MYRSVSLLVSSKITSLPPLLITALSHNMVGIKPLSILSKPLFLLLVCGHVCLLDASVIVTWELPGLALPPRRRVAVKKEPKHCLTSGPRLVRKEGYSSASTHSFCQQLLLIFRTVRQPKGIFVTPSTPQNSLSTVDVSVTVI